MVKLGDLETLKTRKTFGNEIVAFTDISMHKQTFFAHVLRLALKLDDL
jgi:hypothetical protein